MFNEKKISKKIDNRGLYIFHTKIKKNSFVKITNPENSKTVIAQVISNKAIYSNFYNSVITQRIVDETYTWFVNLVKERREIGEYVVRQISDGRILTGRQALELNLIDEIGGNNEAKLWLIENKAVNTDLEILIYGQNKNTNFIELSVAKIMDYFNINSSYGNGLKNNLSLINIDGLLSIWQHPS